MMFTTIKKPFTSTTVVLAAVASAMSLVACGEQQPTGNTFAGKGRVWIAEFDVSDPQRASEAPDVVTVAQRVAALKPPGKFIFATIDGRPLIDAQFLTLDFGQEPAGVNLDGDTTGRFNQARAEGLQPKISRMIATGQRSHWGSGLLEGLQIAAEQPGVERLYFWTDGEIRDPADGFQLPLASDGQIKDEIKKWIPRLRGLRGVRVTIITGSGTVINERTVDRARAMFETILTDVGAHLVWVPTLAQA